ncbi:flagellar basal body-associated protein FliL [Variovorax sp. J22G73]|jgi:flagellar FliL protein|uniref:flagellar basal body-associated protein FliL n=1 Tax=unclassified Variovorax TaxID=663243 RepID=UPI000E32BFB0|nr:MULTISPECIES: flagellar basal body-associated protein FliL [unclassified Variovorax]MDM0007962.1 flagellar basal body-associated protein FliL [Variovorax sp. J22R203]MDM0100416.1 flagellar basal body-associated protein FliL [Variovorax sp. J22G73]
MATSTPAATAVPAAQLPSKRSSKLLIAAVVVVGLAAAAAAAYTFVPHFMKPASETAEPAKVAAPEKPIFLMLEPLTVNLQSEGRARFLQIGMALRVPDEKTKAQIVEYMPELRSRLLMLLSNRTPDTLVTPEGKAKLAEEIRTTLNTPLAAGQPPLGISNVSFNTFVVQ